MASAIWPHGRWQLDLPGEANHAGTTRLEDRHDPMLAYARAVLAAREAALRHGTVATCGKVVVTPNGVNAIPSHVTGSLDARGPHAADVRAVVAELTTLVEAEGGIDHRAVVDAARRALTPTLRMRLAEAARRAARPRDRGRS